MTKLDSPEEEKKSQTVCENTDKGAKATKTKSPPPSIAVKPKTPVLELPHFLRIIGPKHVKIIMQFMPSALIYCVTSLMLCTYMTEWKTTLQYLPYYNGKYAVEVEPVKTVNEGEEEDE